MEDHVKKQIELHKKIAENYDERYKDDYSLLFQRYWNDTIMEAISEKEVSDKKVLEFGCGTGILLEKLTERFSKVYGFDISADMLERINKKSEHLKGVAVGDGMNLPFSDKSFDYVICRGVLHHLPDLQGTLTEINRVLNAEGTLLFSEPSNDSIFVRLARKKMYKESDKFDEDDVGFFSHELKTKLANTNYKLVKIKRFGFLAYIFAGFPDHFSFLAKIPGNKIITSFFIFIDKILSHIPFINRQSLHIIMVANKKSC